MRSRPLPWTLSLLAGMVLAVLAFHRVLAGPDLASGTEPAVSSAEPALKPAGEAARGGNHLAGESSPYLLLHKDNPVDWYPWGEEALERARREDKPIFLSVGYSTCYWCHVMERESFSDPAIAALLNRSFIAIKVDREERPDLDEIYMAATQLLTGGGGWPNSVFLTPQRVPFYAGTYFPPHDRGGRPGMDTLLQGLASAWRERRPEIEETASRLSEALQGYLAGAAEPAAGVPPASLAERSLGLLADRFDAQWGGFGTAPKFPNPGSLWLLQELAGEDPRAAEMLAATLDPMARGGIFDQLGGGFHRYATDRQWRVPHFEKMLYDNGCLLEVYARWAVAGGGEPAARVVRATAAFLAREMTSPEGGLWSAIDAETGGEEGAFYVWSRTQLERAVGGDDAAFLAPILGWDGEPSFEGERYVLYLPRPMEEQAARLGLTAEQLAARFEPLRRRLLAARDARPRPLTDDKVLADWNGTAIAGLATAGRLLEDPALVSQAARAADFVLRHLRPPGGPLQHSWRAGSAHVAAYLSDYAFLVRGLLALHDASGEGRWLQAAQELAAEQIERLGDPQGGFFVAAAAPDLLFRSKDPYDGALPAANAVAVLNLVELARRDRDVARRQRWHDQAEAALRAFGPLVERSPDGLRTLTLAARRFHQAFPGSATSTPTDPPAPSALEAEAKGVVQIGDLVLGPAAGEGWRSFRLPLKIAPGWHLNATPPSLDWLVPTALSGAGLELRQLRYPDATAMTAAWADAEVGVYRGAVELSGELRSSGTGGRLRLTYQACDDQRCLPPVSREIPLP